MVMKRPWLVFPLQERQLDHIRRRSPLRTSIGLILCPSSCLRVFVVTSST